VAKLVKQTRTPEQREGIERLEITHAVLAPLVVRGGKEREERRLTEEVEPPSAWNSVRLRKRAAAFRGWGPVVRA
jgi:hypothetical protein